MPQNENANTVSISRFLFVGGVFSLGKLIVSVCKTIPYMKAALYTIMGYSHDYRSFKRHHLDS